MRVHAVVSGVEVEPNYEYDIKVILTFNDREEPLALANRLLALLAEQGTTPGAGYDGEDDP